MEEGLLLRLTTVADGDMSLPHGPTDAVRMHQVHGATVREVGRAEAGGAPLPETDGLVTREAGVTLLALGADCPLVCLYDPKQPAVAILHAGWRGIRAGVLQQGREILGGGRNVQAWISAHAGPCCYEVGEEVAAEFPGCDVRQPGREKPHLDLRRAVEEALAMPVKPLTDECTICGGGWFSYRRNVTKERHALQGTLTPRIP